MLDWENWASLRWAWHHSNTSLPFYLNDISIQQFPPHPLSFSLSPSFFIPLTVFSFFPSVSQYLSLSLCLDLFVSWSNTYMHEHKLTSTHVHTQGSTHTYTFWLWLFHCHGDSCKATVGSFWAFYGCVISVLLFSPFGNIGFPIKLFLLCNTHTLLPSRLPSSHPRLSFPSSLLPSLPPLSLPPISLHPFLSHSLSYSLSPPLSLLPSLPSTLSLTLSPLH